MDSIIDNTKRLGKWKPTMWEFPACCFDCGEFKLTHPNNHNSYPLKMNKRCCTDCNLRVEEERKKMMIIRQGGWSLNKAYPI